MTLPRAVASSSVPAERTFVLEARDGDRVLARLRARRPVPALVVADEVLGEAEGAPPGPAALSALAGALARFAASPGHEVLVVEKPALVSLSAALGAAGLEVLRRKVFVGRDLVAPLATPDRPWTLRSLAEVGEAAMVERMAAASEGDPFEERKGADRDPVREWRELVESAGPRFDPSGWLLVDDPDGAVGVVLPQSIRPELGTLYYVAVLPARRGRGLGIALHALGLSLLRARGTSRYVGSTDVGNAAMRRVFERNGCVVEGTEAYLGRRVLPPT